MHGPLLNSSVQPSKRKKFWTRLELFFLCSITYVNKSALSFAALATSGGCACGRFGNRINRLCKTRKSPKKKHHHGRPPLSIRAIPTFRHQRRSLLAPKNKIRQAGICRETGSWPRKWRYRNMEPLKWHVASRARHSRRQRSKH